jgi:hypothetical protein
MARLTIRVDVKNIDGVDSTVSKFRTTRLNRVVFHNDGQQNLVVVIKDKDGNDADSTNSPLCIGSTPKPTFEVLPGENMKFKICSGSKWEEFKYTAQIGETKLEDPIVIIERWKFFGSGASLLLGGAIAGAVLYAVVQKALQSRPARPKA